MTRVRVVNNPAGIDALLGEPGVRRVVETVAKAVASAAGEIAPDGGTGPGLAQSYKATRAERTLTGVKATAYTTDIAGHLAEWGSINNPAYAPLRRGAERVGLRTRLAAKGDDS